MLPKIKPDLNIGSALFAKKDVNQTFRLLQHVLVSTTPNNLAKQQLVSSDLFIIFSS